MSQGALSFLPTFLLGRKSSSIYILLGLLRPNQVRVSLTPKLSIPHVTQAHLDNVVEAT